VVTWSVFFFFFFCLRGVGRVAGRTSKRKRRRRRRSRWRRNLVLDLKSNGCEGENQVD
jgi:hypothetical protein